MVSSVQIFLLWFRGKSQMSECFLKTSQLYSAKIHTAAMPTRNAQPLPTYLNRMRALLGAGSSLPIPPGAQYFFYYRLVFVLVC